MVGDRMIRPDIQLPDAGRLAALPACGRRCILQRIGAHKSSRNQQAASGPPPHFGNITFCNCSIFCLRSPLKQRTIGVGHNFSEGATVTPNDLDEPLLPWRPSAEAPDAETNIVRWALEN